MKLDGFTPYVMQMLLTPKDLSFVGYTYKNFDAVKGLNQTFGMHFLLLISVVCFLWIISAFTFLVFVNMHEFVS